MMTPDDALPGQPVTAIDTPALVVDLDAMERNLRRMAEFARAHCVRWRPHAKMHKSAELALALIDAGAVGACVQKTSEAEALARGGVRDIYISNEVIDAAKLRRVAALACRLGNAGGRLAIAVDSSEGVRRLAAAFALRDTANGDAGSDQENEIDVFVEIDVGQRRCGVMPGTAAVGLAREIMRHRALRFAGLQAYHGGAQHMRSIAERRAAVEDSADAVKRTLDALRDAGIDDAPLLVTGAGTGTFAFEAASRVWGEIQPGSFLFMDADYALNEHDPEQPAFEHALFVKSQVMSRSRDHAVCDAGHKSHAVDSGMPRVHAPGQQCEPAAAALVFTNGGDEHGILHAADGKSALPGLGDTVWLIPGHCDPTVNLHDRIYGVRGGLEHGVVERVIRVDARGAVG